MNTWYLAQLKPNSLNIASRHLHQQGFETFCPTEEVTRRVSGRFVKKTQALFPGYVFVSLDPTAGLWKSVNSTRGITKLVSFGSAPAAVPTGLVEGIRKRCDAEGKLAQIEPFKPGETVQLTHGPFADYIGTIEKIDRSKRIFILMEMMGAKTRVVVEETQIKSCPA